MYAQSHQNYFERYLDIEHETGNHSKPLALAVFSTHKFSLMDGKKVGMIFLGQNGVVDDNCKLLVHGGRPSVEHNGNATSSEERIG